MTSDPVDGELDLWSLVSTLVRGRWLIALVTAVAVGTVGFLSFFVLPPVYEARSTLVVAQTPQPSLAAVPGLEKLSEVLTALAQMPTVSPEGIEAQITNPALLARVGERLGLADPPEALARRVSVTRPRGGNMVEVSVSRSDPRAATAFVNALTDSYIELLNELSRTRLQNASAILGAEIATEAQAYEAAQAELTEFLKDGRGLDELRSELASRIDLLTRYRARIAVIDVDSAALAAELASLERDLAAQLPVIRTQRGLIDFPLMSAAEAERSGESPLEGAGLTVISEVVNPVYVALLEKAALLRSQVQRLTEERRAAETAAEVLAGDADRVRLELTEREARYALLQNRVDLRQGIVRTLTSRYEEVRVSQAAASLPIVVVPAVVPQVPVGPRKLLNVTVAAMLGVMAGVMLVFLRAGWESARARFAGEAAAPAGGRAALAPRVAGGARPGGD